MTQFQEAIRDKITKYSDACGMCTDTTKECDTCGITCVLEDLTELQKLANDPEFLRSTAHWIQCDLVMRNYDDGVDIIYRGMGLKCSRCARIYDKTKMDIETNYCPHCGARIVNADD